MFGHKLADVKGQALTCDVMSSQVYFGVPHGDHILESGDPVAAYDCAMTNSDVVVLI